MHLLPSADTNLFCALQLFPDSLCPKRLFFRIDFFCNLNLAKGRTGLDTGCSPFPKICPLNLHPILLISLFMHLSNPCPSRQFLHSRNDRS
jgi:hypothetical protein